MAGGKRGRPKQSAEAKERKAEEKARKSEQLGMEAMSKLPATAEGRNEKFTERDRLKDDAKEATGELGAFRKSMRQVYGILSEAEKIRDILVKAKPGMRETIMRQAGLLIADANLEIQGELFAELQPGMTAPDKPIMDSRGHTGGFPTDVKSEVKDQSPNGAVPERDTGTLPLDEAEQAFAKANAKVAARKPRGTNRSRIHRNEVGADAADDNKEVGKAIVEQTSEAVKEGDAHIARVGEELAQKRRGPPPAPTKPAVPAIGLGPSAVH